MLSRQLLIMPEIFIPIEDYKDPLSAFYVYVYLVLYWPEMRLNRATKSVSIHIAYPNLFTVEVWWLLYSCIANCAKHDEKMK